MYKNRSPSHSPEAHRGLRINVKQFLLGVGLVAAGFFVADAHEVHDPNDSLFSIDTVIPTIDNVIPRTVADTYVDGIDITAGAIAVLGTFTAATAISRRRPE